MMLALLRTDACPELTVPERQSITVTTQCELLKMQHIALGFLARRSEHSACILIWLLQAQATVGDCLSRAPKLDVHNLALKRLRMQEFTPIFACQALEVISLWLLLRSCVGLMAEPD